MSHHELGVYVFEHNNKIKEQKRKGTYIRNSAIVYSSPFECVYLLEQTQSNLYVFFLLSKLHLGC